MSTFTTSTSPAAISPTDPWSRFFGRLIPILAVAGPALGLVAALFVTFQVQMLPGDLDWISEPESFFFYVGAIAYGATWIVVGRTIAARATRTGIVVTILGVLGAVEGVSAAVWRHVSIGMVDQGVDAGVVYDAWENPTLFASLSFVVTWPAFFLAPIIAGIAILTTKVAPAWAAVALLCFGPTLMAAQGFYAATELTYPLAWVFMLAAVVGIQRADRAQVSS